MCLPECSLVHVSTICVRVCDYSVFLCVYTRNTCVCATRLLLCTCIYVWLRVRPCARGWKVVNKSVLKRVSYFPKTHISPKLSRWSFVGFFSIVFCCISCAHLLSRHFPAWTLKVWSALRIHCFICILLLLVIFVAIFVSHHVDHLCTCGFSSDTEDNVQAASRAIWPGPVGESTIRLIPDGYCATHWRHTEQFQHQPMTIEDARRCR